ncbi:hypothetical protein HQ520_01845 [bacterium]|nr:hypothetical protein [bacterium]
MIHRSLAVVTLFIGLTACYGGRTDQGPVAGTRIDDPAFSAGQINSANFLDRSIARKVEVLLNDADRAPGGTLEAIALLRNRTSKPLVLEGRTTFFDKDRFPSDGPTAWQKIFLAPHSRGIYRERSTKVNEASYYYIELREAK